jgi:hypothetical protein
MGDEVIDCPAERLTFSRDTNTYDEIFGGMPRHLVTPEEMAVNRKPGGMDLRMDCADCGLWWIMRYHPDYDIDKLHDNINAMGRHKAPFEAFIRGVRVGQFTPMARKV